MTALPEVIKARRDHLIATTRCRSCWLTRAQCRALADPNDPLCCPDCEHPVSTADMDALLAEVASGVVRTVEEADPPPIQGPQPVTFHWLLRQGEYWRTRDGRMIEISSMTDTHRLHTVRMLQRQAAQIALHEHARDSMWLDHPLGPSGDMARDAFEHGLHEMLAEPITWLMGCPLLKALAAPLPKPTKRKQWARLEERALHWSDCPASRNLDEPCRCRVENPDNPQVGPPVDRALFDEASGKGIL